MKKLNTPKKYVIAFLLTAVIAVTGNKSLFAQSCNQVEILYTEPDCYKADQHDGAGGNPSNGGKGCKEISACVKQLYNYASSVSGPGWTYNWTVTGPAAVTINPNNTSQTININWPQQGDYTLTLTATDVSGNIFTFCVLVHVKEKPVANFTFTPNNVCAGSTISFTGTTTYSGSFMSTWDFGDPASGNSNFTSSSGNTTVSHLYNAPGTYTVTLIAYSFTVVNGGPNGDSSVHVRTCCADTIKKQVTIKPGSIHIECVSTVCAGDTVKYTAVGCTNPTWSLPVGGNILSQTANTVTIVWGNGNPQGQIMATCPGGCLASVPVPIIPTTPMIVGNTTPCVSSITSYSLPLLPGTTYTWTLTNITNASNQTALLNAYPDNNTVWINWALAPPGNYQLSITLNNQHKCCSSSGTLNITPMDKWKVYMDMTICQGSAASLGISPAAGTFNWTVLPPNGGVVPLTGGPGNTFSPIFNNIGTYTVQVYESANTYCNSGIANPQQVKIKVVATLPAGIISGPTTICTNTPYTYTIPAPPAGYYYTWSITNGTATFQPGNLPTATGNNVSIVWTSLPGTISVILQRNDQPPCPSAPSILNVIQATVGNVTGLISVCVDGLTGYKLTGGNLPPGEPVSWTIAPPGLGTIINGQGTDTITVLWHGQPGTGPWGPATISATTGCGNAVSLGGIMIYPKFSVSITSSGTDICSPGGVTLTVNGVPPLATISWLPGLQNTASINVTVAQTYTVTVTKGGCSDTKTFTVPDPFAIVPVTCGVGFCNGVSTNEILGVNVIKPGSGTFTYEWHSGTCTSPGPILSTVTNTNLSNSYTATAPGNYCVIVKYGTCQRCINFTVKKVCCPDVNHPSITYTRNSCNQYVFTGTTPNPTNAPITWNFGDTVAQGASGVPVTHTYAHAGTYCVTFCVGAPTPNPTNCTGNCDVKTVVVPIEASFIYTLGCNGCLNITNTSVVITSNPSYVTYLWNFGDASTSTAQTPPQHCYANPGTYTVTLTISYNDGLVSCTSTATQAVVYTALSINASTPVCTGSPSYFSSTPGGFVTYAWAFGDGFTAYTAGTTHIYNSPLTYSVTLSVTDALGNTCKDTTPVNVKPGISNCTILPAYICPGGTATLSTTNVAGYTYLWEIETSPNVFASAPGVNTNSTYTTNTPGFYHVVVYNSYNCPCTSNKVEVKAVTKPKALIGAAPSTHLCGPSTLMLTSINHLPGDTSDWYANGIYGPALSSGQMYYIPVVGTTTPYSLVLTNEYGCSDTCIMTVFVNPIPVQPSITSNPPGNLCEGGPIQLTVTNYPTNITWNNGAIGSTITVYTAGIYTATYTDPVTGCSSNKSIKVNARPATGLFPHFCDSIPCRCVRPFTIYAPQPLIVNGVPSGNYSIQWYNPTFSGVTGPVFNNAVTGSYYIIVKDLTTGCIDTSDVYSIKVPPCDTCDCKGSHWGDIILTPGEQHPDIRANIVIPKTDSIKLECHKAQKLDCNKTYTINASFFCKDTTCKGKVTYSLQPPSGSPITGNAPLTFTTPATSGTYILTLYGWCGDKKCDSCVIDLIVQCDGCDCKGSKWGPIKLTGGVQDDNHDNGKIANVGGVIDPNGISLICNKTYSLDCNKPYSINASYLCKDSACNGKVTYSLQPPTGMPITGTMALNFTPTINGVYVLTLYGWCGNKICDSCIIKFEVKCNPCNCAGSKWGEKTYTVQNSTQTISCGKEYVVKCRSTVTVNANYVCADPHCNSAVTYTLIPPAGSPTSGTVPLTFIANQAGTYTVVLYGWCGGKICDSCVVRFKPDCVETDCCPYDIKVDTSKVSYDYVQVPNATVLTENFSISGLSLATITEVRAEVMSYTIADNYNKECMKCVNLPFTWASISSATNIGPVSPKITMYGGTTVTSFNGSGTGAYQNPREVIWNNGSAIPIPNNTNIGINFLVPPPPLIDCCELKGRICVKFTFRDKDCKECEAIGCFEFLIKNKKAF